MKKKPVIWSLALAAVCGIMLGIMMSAPDVKCLDVSSKRTYKPVTLEGDSDLVQVYDCGLDCELYTGIELDIRSSTSDIYALSGKSFCNGQLVETGVSDSAVVVERMEGEEWIRWPGSDYEQDALGGGKTYVPVISKQKLAGVKVFFPAHLPGHYRITLNFRKAEIYDRGGYILSTSDESYSVFFYYDVDEWQDFGGFKATASLKRFSADTATAAVVIKSTDRPAPFRDTSYAELDATETGAYAVVSEEPLYGRNLYLEHYGIDNMSDRVASYLVSLRDLDNSDYKLTLRFAENPDGSGEQYTLTLNLRFDE